MGPIRSRYRNEQKKLGLELHPKSVFDCAKMKTVDNEKGGNINKNGNQNSNRYIENTEISQIQSQQLNMDSMSHTNNPKTQKVMYIYKY